MDRTRDKLTLVAATTIVALVLVLAGEAQAAGPIEVRAPSADQVLVAGSKAVARAMRVPVALAVAGRPSGLAATLNGQALPLPAPRRGRIRLTLTRKAGLELGQNRLRVTAGRRSSGRPRWVAGRQFVVGHRDGRGLGVRVRLGAGAGPAAVARVTAPRKTVLRLEGRLNGRRVPVKADVGTTHLRKLNLAQLGAHHGANRLRVRLIMMDGRVGEKVARFRLERGRSIAVAREAGPAIVGRTIALRSDRSRLRGADRTRWKLLSRPADSHARLHGNRAPSAALRPDVPGHYRVALTVGRGDRRGTDVLRLSATPPNPLVALDSVTFKDDTQGMTLNGVFWPVDDDDQMQVMVLDRATAGVITNNGYQTNSLGISTLTQDLGKLDDTKLVIAQVQGAPAAELGDLDTALRQIGGTVPARWTFGDAACWSGGTDGCTSTWQRAAFDGHPFTVVGVPGLAPGQAWRSSAAQTGGDDGAITGAFTPGTIGDTGGKAGYTFVNGGADHYALVDTCSGSSSFCPVQIGDQLYQPGPGVSGIHVVAVDRTTLAPIVNRTVTTTDNLLAALTTPGPSTSVGHFVPSTAMDDQRLVLLQSVGTGGLTGAPSTRLLEYVDQLGGTPERLVDAIANRSRYALVGAATDLPWRNDSALESSTLGTSGEPGEPTGRISGAVERKREGLYAPLTGDPVQVSNLSLLKILYQPPQGFPYVGDPAVGYIAQNIGLNGYPDVRSAYYLQTSIVWANKVSQLKDLTCDDVAACGANFAAVKAQLLVEFPWVDYVKEFAKDLAALYQVQGGTSAFDVAAITDEVQKSVPPPSSSTMVTMRWLKIMTNVMAIASGAAKLAGQPEVSAAFGLVGSAGSLSTAVMDTAGGAPDDTVVAAAQNLDDELAYRSVAFTVWTGQMATILLYDYGKLQTVGAALGGDDATWGWPADTSNMIYGLEGGTRASAYTALVPTTWPGWNLKPDGVSQTSSDDVTQLACDGNVEKSGTNTYPFAGALPDNQYHAATTIDGAGHAVDQVWTFATLSGWSGTGKRIATVPATSLTGSIYGPGSQNVQSGAFQYGPDWWRDTYNPPGHTICLSSGFLSSAFPPPNAGQPLP